MSRDMTTFDLGYGDVKMSQDYYGEITLISVEEPNVSLTFQLPDEDDPEDLAKGVTINMPRRYGGYDLATAEAMSAVLTTAIELAGQINDANSTAVEDAKRRLEEAERERQRVREEREAVLTSRRDRLMMEFVGERVKIRERGIKGMRPAIIEVKEETTYDYDKREYTPTGEWQLHFAYTNSDDRFNRTQQLDVMRRLDIKVGSRWQNLWDDGDDDLSEWDRRTPVSSAKKVQPYDGGLA